MTKTLSPSKTKEYLKKWGREYYLKNKERILERERQRYSQLTPEEKQYRLDQARERRHRTKQKRIEENISSGKANDKYAKARLLGFRSMFEVRVVEAMEAEGLSYEYEPHYIPYVIKGNYKPDFVLPNGIVIEAKGYLDAGTCRKMLAVKASNPHLDIRFVFQNANGKRNKRAKLRNWEWAEKHGFPWAEGTIPLSWWKEPKVEGTLHD